MRDTVMSTIAENIKKLEQEKAEFEEQQRKAAEKEEKRRLKELERLEGEYEAGLKKVLLRIPQIIDPSVPIGKDDTENVVVYEWGEKRKFDFKPLQHYEIAENLDIIERMHQPYVVIVPSYMVFKQNFHPRIFRAAIRKIMFMARYVT